MVHAAQLLSEQMRQTLQNGAVRWPCKAEASLTTHAGNTAKWCHEDPTPLTTNVGTIEKWPCKAETSLTTNAGNTVEWRHEAPTPLTKNVGNTAK